VIHILYHLRRVGLIKIEWEKRNIKREKTIKNYVVKQIITSELWPKIITNWEKASNFIQIKYGKVNPEYGVYLTSYHS
jgi:hypothetical protein